MQAGPAGDETIIEEVKDELPLEALNHANET
jgi:hypothetical protein